MAYRKIIIPFIFSMLFYCSAASQDSNTNMYKDSGTKPVDNVVEEDESTSQGLITDTTLRLNGLSLSVDSIDELKNSKQFAYAKNMDSLLLDWQKKLAAKKDATEKNIGLLERFFNSSLTKIFLWSLAAFFILAILYKLFFAEGFFQKNISRKNVVEINDKENTPIIFDYDLLITQAINNHNYRLAVRYFYLQTLQILSGKGLLQLGIGKTNYQYIGALGNTTYKDDFLWLTLNYEYVWYGEFDVDAATASQLQNKFKQFNTRILQN